MQLRRHYNLQVLLMSQSTSSQPSLYITLYLAKCPPLEAAAMQQRQQRQRTLLQTRLASCPDLTRFEMLLIVHDAHALLVQAHVLYSLSLDWGFVT